jgi:hypothetical protein
MPVQKFRSFDEAREALWGDSGDPAYFRRIAWLWAFADRLYPRRYPAGVHRFTSIDEADLQRQSWEAAGGRRGS